MQTKPCTLGKRHKWNFKNNRIVQTHSSHTVRISNRGLYECACGAKKIGDYRPN